jgi:AraC-like DNA-binding protein
MALERDTFRRLCVARELLRDVRDEPLSVDEVARRLTLSRFHFIRQFESLFGATPVEYRTLSRIERAKHMLALGELSVTEVCCAVGFTSLGTFSALFKRRVGATPSEFQRRTRTLVQVPGTLPHELVPGCLTLMRRLPPDAFRKSEEA